jgi:putative selenate reductase
VSPGAAFRQAIQIVHVDDLCNECGNCGFFCPYEGRPFIDKPTLFGDEAALCASLNAGFAFSGPAETPALLVRAETGSSTVAAYPFEAWSAAASGSPLLAVARAIHDGHRYMVAGGQA